MKYIITSLFILLGMAAAAPAQNEQSPLVEKDIAYKNWKFKDVRTGSETSLKKLTEGKKLVMVVYFAPWCPNWRHDAPIVERLYETYKDNGLQVVGIGEYDPVESMRTNLTEMKVAFPVVFESESRADKQKTSHYEYRRSTGDTRNWGSPWYIFLEPAKMLSDGDVLTRRTDVVNGEIIEAEVEKMIRARLGLAAGEKQGLSAASPLTTVGKTGEIEPCTPETKKP